MASATDSKTPDIVNAGSDSDEEYIPTLEDTNYQQIDLKKAVELPINFQPSIDPKTKKEMFLEEPNSLIVYYDYIHRYSLPFLKEIALHLGVILRDPPPLNLTNNEHLRYDEEVHFNFFASIMSSEPRIGGFETKWNSTEPRKPIYLIADQGRVNNTRIVRYFDGFITKVQTWENGIFHSESGFNYNPELHQRIYFKDGRLKSATEIDETGNGYYEKWTEGGKGYRQYWLSGKMVGFDEYSGYLSKVKEEVSKVIEKDPAGIIASYK